jgi:hypothetical protein
MTTRDSEDVIRIVLEVGSSLIARSCSRPPFFGWRPPCRRTRSCQFSAEATSRSSLRASPWTSCYLDWAADADSQASGAVLAPSESAPFADLPDAVVPQSVAAEILVIAAHRHDAQKPER